MKAEAVSRIVLLVGFFMLSTSALSDVRPTSLASAYLPDAILSAYKKFVRKHDLETSTLKNTPSLVFRSGESHANGKPVFNQVSLISDAGYDLWLMRQLHGDFSQPVHKSFIGIFIDKTSSPHTAYYLQWNSQSVLAEDDFIRHEAPCLKCHASGPRAIRPVSSPLVPEFSEQELKVMRQWNDRIVDYGRVENFDAFLESGGNVPPMRNYGQQESAKLEMNVCSGCHQDQNAIRNSLRRTHRESIEYLTQHLRGADGYMIEGVGFSEMPVYDHALTAFERSCLETWLAGNALPSGCRETR